MLPKLNYLHLLYLEAFFKRFRSRTDIFLKRFVGRIRFENVISKTKNERNSSSISFLPSCVTKRSIIDPRVWLTFRSFLFLPLPSASGWQNFELKSSLREREKEKEEKKKKNVIRAAINTYRDSKYM